jgi:hypothetical protein
MDKKYSRNKCTTASVMAENVVAKTVAENMSVSMVKIEIQEDKEVLLGLVQTHVA